MSQPSWNLKEFMSSNLVNATWDKVREAPAWWRDELFPLITEKELMRLRHLMSAYDVVFCTSRNARNPDGPGIAAQTISWLETRGLRRPSVVLSKRKGEIARAIGATHAIDDRPENVCMTHWLSDGRCKSFVLDRPYNRNYPLPSGIVRVSNLEEFFQSIEGPSIQAPLDKHPSSAHFDFTGGRKAA